MKRIKSFFIIELSLLDDLFHTLNRLGSTCKSIKLTCSEENYSCKDRAGN